ncbi:2-C-methyl-D-erythritol 4-phosphate cytidylyltransferase [Demequina sp. TMPB413]|uniref:2-C-methyl-D-erythritol 4-phosphate cytidylyltransferase n=1 Tax=Demequina sp. TMPB413 TaxID=2881056 RepID=UPI001CF25A50|nr:2-C-methyl-D-erythritol 4-phosphate cytidylyltransferase [Demequina sp. TMPB413]UPU87461.1 2-C-methyl-D-erythritol 4-phosphate cytidylyltransferase [Demequina sp. TMPB413]
MTTAAVLTAAGSGSRLARDIPKGLVTVGGTPLVTWAASALATVCERIVVTAPADAVADFVDAVAGVAARVEVVVGGGTRQASVARGLDALADLGGGDAVLVHDAARPFMPVAVFGRLLDALETCDAVIPVLPVVDTIVTGVGGEVSYLDRQSLGAVQTPQALLLSVLRESHERAQADGVEATDDGALALRYGFRLATVEGDVLGSKITYPADLAAAQLRITA